MVSVIGAKIASQTPYRFPASVQRAIEARASKNARSTRLTYASTRALRQSVRVAGKCLRPQVGLAARRRAWRPRQSQKNHQGLIKPQNIFIIDPPDARTELGF